MPAYEIVNEFGRKMINPEYVRIREILLHAQDRIGRARSPDAYVKAIIARERKPVQSERRTA